MAHVLQILESFPPINEQLSPHEYDASIIQFIQDLKKLPHSIWTDTSNGKNLLESLDPAVNTIPYLYALSGQIQASKDDAQLEQLKILAAIFLTTFDPIQVRYVGFDWRSLFEFICANYLRSRTTELRPLTIALLRLDPTAGTFTSLHLYIVRACLSAGVPSQALPILDKDIYAFPQDAAKNAPGELWSEKFEASNAYLTPRSGLAPKPLPEHVLEYYLLGALVYIGQRNFDRARLFLEITILSPSLQSITSALQVEAYKKWVLVGLLTQGKAFPLPRTVDMVHLRDIRASAKPYDALAEAFEKRDRRKFEANVDAGASIWQEDGNIGLIQGSVQALLHFRILDLQKTYAALTVRRVSKHLDLPLTTTTELLTSMITSGGLDARIESHNGESVLRLLNPNPSDTTTTTTTPPSSTDAASAKLDLEAQVVRILGLTAALRDADRRVQLTKEYVDVQKRTKRTLGPEADPADAMDMTWDPPLAPSSVDDADEDIMAT